MVVNLSAARAASSFIELRQLTLRLPDGRVLLDGCTHTFGPGLTGLVGANGSGKSMLARHIAQSVAADGRLHYVAQQVGVPLATTFTTSGAIATVADIAGLGALLAASSRMDAGAATAADFDLLDGRWSALSGFSAALQAPTG